MQSRFTRTIKFIQGNKFNPRLMRGFDWPVLLLVLGISLFGIVTIFAATATPVDRPATSLLEMLSTQSTQYARLQFLWLLAGMVLMFMMIYFDYEFYANWANTIYWANIALLVVVLFMARGRGNVAAWFRWGADATRTIQPAEFGKLAIIIALAKLFAGRSKPITRVAELVPVLAYIGLPLLLIVAQPDVGTALVYIVIFAVMLFASGTSSKILIGIVAIAVLALVPIWYGMQTQEGNFRADRITSFFNQNANLQDSNFQTYNAKLAVGSGGLWGKGLFSQGSIASLNYIPDDHTDFAFAILCETFGFVGAGALCIGYLLLMIRMIALSSQAVDGFGTYCIIGVAGMIFFHVLENIGMVIGLLPVTGIPLPLVSYGGSNFLTTMMGVALVLNVSMRSRDRRRRVPERPVAKL